MPSPAFDELKITKTEMLALRPAGPYSHRPALPVNLAEAPESDPPHHWLTAADHKWLATVQFNPSTPKEEQRANLDMLCGASADPEFVDPAGKHTPGPWGFEAQGEANLFYVMRPDGAPLARVLFNGHFHLGATLGVLALWEKASQGADLAKRPAILPLPMPQGGVERGLK